MHTHRLTTRELFEEASRLFPETRLVSREMNGSLFQTTLTQMGQRVNALGWALEAVGVAPGDTVGLMGWSSHRCVELFFAVTGLGATLIPMNPEEEIPKELPISLDWLFAAELVIPSLETRGVGGSPDIVAITEKRDHPRYAINVEALMAKHTTEQGYPWPKLAEWTPCLMNGGDDGKGFQIRTHRDVCLGTLSSAAHLGAQGNRAMLQPGYLFEYGSWDIFLVALVTGTGLVFSGVPNTGIAHGLRDMMVRERICVTRTSSLASHQLVLPGDTRTVALNEHGQPDHDSRGLSCHSFSPLFPMGCGDHRADGYELTGNHRENIALEIEKAMEFTTSFEMEGILMGSGLLKEAAVLFIKHPRWKKRPLAIVVPREMNEKKEVETQLFRHLAASLSVWAMPDEILFVERLPRTGVDKLSKQALHKSYENHFTQRGRHEL